MRSLRRVDPRRGYDRWADSYDATANPVVAMDNRHTLAALQPARGETILDAGCGTGRHLTAMAAAGCRPVGLDFSFNMLRRARRKNPRLRVAQADLGERLPLRPGRFDAAVCALVGEHLRDLGHLFRELWKALRPGGRLVFSVFHPEMAAAGSEANFEQRGVEYRLGAERHRVGDYLTAADDAGFDRLQRLEAAGDQTLADQVPSAQKYVGFPMLLVIQGRKTV